MFRMRHFLF
jgi:uncharacterized membrane protein YgcG